MGQGLAVNRQLSMWIATKGHSYKEQGSLNKKVDIFMDIGIIARRSKHDLALNSDEIQTASRALLSYPVSTRCHRRQMAICPVTVVMAFRTSLFNR